MGCAGSKPSESASEQGGAGAKEAKSVPEDAIGGGTGNKEKRMSMTKRRIAVRAEVAEEYKAEDFPDIPKTNDEAAELKKALQASDLFAACKEEQLDFLVKGFTKKGFEPGETVINQGEAGDDFFVVSTGEFVASLEQKGNDIVATYSGGMCFGELALLYNSPRAATVTCKTSGMCWALERKRFRYVMTNSGSGALGQTATFLKTVPILSELKDEQRAVLSDNIDTLSFKDGEYVCQMGDIADALYIIKTGDVVYHQEKGGDKRRGLQGEVFGESCLEPTSETAVRKANVVAVGDAVLLRLKADTVKEHLGNLKDVLDINFKRKVMEGVIIEDIHIFNELVPDEQDDLIAKLGEKKFSPDATLIEAGKENDTFYVIKTGSAKVIQKGAPGTSEQAVRVLNTLTAGCFFGERALLQKEPATMSIVASESADLIVYTLDAATFQQIFGGPLKALLDKVVAKREEEANQPDRPKFNDLELRRILGVGTFGRVKLVVHKPSGNTYALKCMRKAQVVATKQQSHVLNEKKILAMMKHPFILALVQTYQDAGELYMLIELSLGGELFTLLAKRAPLFDKPAHFYVASVVSMFTYMHNLKVVYRDLKPENLLLDKKGFLKLVDFGFAKIIADRTWTLCGTPEYLAPEIILNKGHGFGADWWCVGILAFECLTGTTPFVSNEPMEGYRKIIKCRVPWPGSMSAPAKDFIDRLLCVDPTRRLGCLKGGSKDVRNHPWMKDLCADFKSLESKSEPAPYVPKIKSDTDDSNFDQYTDEGKANYPQEDFPKDMFAEFADEWV